jgi:hypothetical protein
MEPAARIELGRGDPLPVMSQLLANGAVVRTKSMLCSVL